MAGEKPQSRRLSDEERFDWVRLIRCENVGPHTFRMLLKQFGGARAALDALPELARRGGAARPIAIAPVEAVMREFDAARKIGVRFLALGEPEYPLALSRIDSAPPLISLRGRDEALQQPAVAIVGSRNASAAGLTFADRLARGLGEAGYVVVSGLARGVDQRAHVASIATGAIGVLAGGHGRPYPPEAVPLIARIAEFGAVVSEMPIEWEARARDFPRRNRIVSGLALGVVVVEAARGSGSLITARIAAEQNREVFAVPGSPLDPRAEGANDLLRDGAHLCARVEDILSVLEPLRARDPRTLFAEGAAQGEEGLWGAEGLKTMAAPASGTDDGRDQSRAASSERDATQRIVSMLSPSPISLDDLARAAEASAREVRVALIELELAGRIEFSGGNRVALRGFDGQS